MHALGNNSNLFDESNYVTQHSDMSIITENCAKISHQLPQCWGTTSKSYVKQCYWFGTLYRGRGVNFKLTFKNSRNILLLIVWNLQKKKKKKAEFWCQLLQITQVCFYDSDYVMQHSDMSIMRENCAKITHKLPQY